MLPTIGTKRAVLAEFKKKEFNMITGSIWFAGNECIGIVQVIQENQIDEYRQTGNADFKYYIGVGKGQNEKTDAQYIAEWGMPFDRKAGNVLFNVIPGIPI